MISSDGDGLGRLILFSSLVGLLERGVEAHRHLRLEKLGAGRRAKDDVFRLRGDRHQPVRAVPVVTCSTPGRTPLTVASPLNDSVGAGRPPRAWAQAEEIAMADSTIHVRTATLVRMGSLSQR